MRGVGAARRHADAGVLDAHTGEAPRPNADRQHIEIPWMRTALSQQCVDVLEQRLRARVALTEHFAVIDERTRCHLCCSVERQRQHSSIETILRAPSA